MKEINWKHPFRLLRKWLGLHIWIKGQCRRCGVIWSANDFCTGEMMSQKQWDEIHQKWQDL